MNQFVLKFILAFVLCFMLVATPNIGVIRASGTIYIRADGNVEGTDKIQRQGNIYTFTGNVFDSIFVERDNIVIDDAGYVLNGTGNGRGIYLSERDNLTIKNIEIKEFFLGISLDNSSNNLVTGNIIDENNYGILLSNCSNSIISENNVTANRLFAILLDLSSNNSINENKVTHNDVDIELNSSPNNVLRDNSMDNNVANFRVVPKLDRYLNSVNDVDISNTVDGKPIYYWVNQKDRTVHSDAGCIVLVNCTHITVKNLNLTNNGEGVLLVFTTNSTITKNNITNNNGFIIYFHDSSDNIFYNNAFINNELGVEDSSVWSYWVTPSVNIWDNGYPSGGNHWDDYDGVDSDGIGDTPYVIYENNQDNYPLMDHGTPITQQSEPLPTIWIIVAIVIIAVVGAAVLLVYFTKAKNQPNK